MYDFKVSIIAAWHTQSDEPVHIVILFLKLLFFKMFWVKYVNVSGQYEVNQLHSWYSWTVVARFSKCIVVKVLRDLLRWLAYSGGALVSPPGGAVST